MSRSCRRMKIARRISVLVLFATNLFSLGHASLAFAETNSVSGLKSTNESGDSKLPVLDGSDYESSLFISKLDDPALAAIIGKETIALTAQALEMIIEDLDEENETPIHYCAGGDCEINVTEDKEELIIPLPQDLKLRLSKRRNSRNSKIKLEGLLIPLTFHIECDDEGNCIMRHDLFGFGVGEICRTQILPDNHLKLVCKYFEVMKLDCELWQEAVPSEQHPNAIRFCRSCNEISLPDGSIIPGDTQSCSEPMDPQTAVPENERDPMRILPDFLPFLPVVFPGLFQ